MKVRTAVNPPPDTQRMMQLGWMLSALRELRLAVAERRAGLAAAFVQLDRLHASEQTRLSSAMACDRAAFAAATTEHGAAADRLCEQAEAQAYNYEAVLRGDVALPDGRDWKLLCMQHRQLLSRGPADAELPAGERERQAQLVTDSSLSLARLSDELEHSNHRSSSMDT